MSDVDHPSDEAFFESLSVEDDLGMVVRAHIHVEAMLLEMIDLLVPNPEPLKKMELEFHQRVTLAVALGKLDEKEAPALRALGKLRNDFAHRLDTQLSKDRVNNLYNALSADQKGLIQHVYRREGSGGPSFKEMSPRDRFIAMAISLRAMLLARIIDIRKSRDQGGSSTSDQPAADGERGPTAAAAP